MKVERVLSGLGMIDGQQVTLDPPPEIFVYHQDFY